VDEKLAVDDAIYAELFLAHIQEAPVPTLVRGDMAIMDK
jgi:hypothetical protein